MTSWFYNANSVDLAEGFWDQALRAAVLEQSETQLKVLLVSASLVKWLEK